MGGENTQVNEPQGQESGESTVDYSEILRSTQEALTKQGQTVESLRADLQERDTKWGRLEKAIKGDEGEKLTPYQARMREFEELGKYLDKEALENQKRGGAGLPLTTKIGQQLVQYGRDAEARAEKLEAELSEIKRKLDYQSNPAYQGLERAAFAMEGMLQQGLEEMYPGGENNKVRAGQFDAISAMINAEIKDLMANDKEGLLKVQRDPKVMRRMVNHFMAQAIPPKAREIMDNERIRNEPENVTDLYAAMADAKRGMDAAHSENDAKRADHFSALMTEIRQKILAHQFGGGGRSEKKSEGSINGLLNSFGGQIR